MRVLVTGGAGFIGSHIVNHLLAAGHEPQVLDDLSTGDRTNLPDSVPLNVADICDQEALQTVFDRVRPECVCHQAAQMSVSRSVREPAFDARVNILGWINVLEACIRFGTARVIFASSGGVLYGEVSEPAGEEHPCAPVSPYGISKWTGEQYLQFFAMEHGLQTVALRYSNVFGPRQNPHGEAGVVAIFARRLINGEPALINGDGKYVRDYVYVDDVARANCLCLERTLPSEFVALNIGTGVGTDVNQLEEMLRNCCSERLAAAGQTTALPPPIHREPRPGDLRSNILSAERAREVLGWTPAVDFETGLGQTVAWFHERAAQG